MNDTHAGTGVGLHLTRSLVELHHGTIHVENNPEGQPGCRFIVRLPMGCTHLPPEAIGADECEGRHLYTIALLLRYCLRPLRKKAWCRKPVLHIGCL